MTDSDSIYYYASLENGYNNLISETLYFSDITEFNDTEEVKYIRDELQKVVENSDQVYEVAIEIIAEIVIPLVNIIFKLEKLEDYKGNKKYKHLESEEKNLEKPGAYVFCCSKKKDDLSMWKFYGGNVGGVVIEFDRKVIEQSINDIYIKEVNYDKKSLCDNLKKIINTFADELKPKLEKLSSTELEDIEKIISPDTTVFWNSLMEEVIFSKNNNWQHEEEVRIFHKGVDESLEDSIRNGRKRTFWKIKFPIEAIKGIKLGPLSTQEQMEYFEELIKKENLQIKLEKSAIGYRG